MSEEYGGFDYYRMTKFEVLAEKEDQSISGGSSIYVPDSNGVDISKYKLKTVSIKADYALSVAYEVSDDRENWDTYHSFTLTANTLDTRSFEEDFKYLRIKITNSDTNSHTLNRCRIKVRRI